MSSVEIELYCHEPRQAARIFAFWQRTYPNNPSPVKHAAATAKITFLQQHDTTWPPQRQKEICSIDDLQISQIAMGYLFSIGNSWIAVDVAGNSAVSKITEQFWQASLNQQREFFRFAVFVLLRKHGIYGIHANALDWGGQGVLIIGASGRGKTSLSLSLLDAGWQAVADDAVGLYSDERMIRALALRRGFSCTPETVRAFPGLQKIAHRSPRLQRDKRWLNIEAHYPDRFTDSTSIALLLFPTIGMADSTRLHPLDTTRTVSELVLYSPAVMIDLPTVALQMKLFTQLVQQAAAYQIILGRDVFSHPAHVSELIRSVIPACHALH